MFDISWTEFVLIGVVALIVIGPKELPGVMRTMGQWTRKVRGMAADFQNQFQEAMREAEMADLKKQVDDMAHDIKNYDPLKDVRSDFDAMGKSVESAVTRPPEQKAAPAAAVPGELPAQDAEVPAIESAVPAETALPAEPALPAIPVERSALEPAEADAADHGTEPPAPAAPPDSTGRPE